MELSIVIPCFNGAATLGDTLDAIGKQQWDKHWEVILSDNGSTDDSVAVAETFRDRLPNLRIIDSSAEQGQPFALNNGVRHARGQSVLFCDADDIPLPGWLRAMGEALFAAPLVACRTDVTTINPAWITQVRGNPQENGLHKLPYPPYCVHAGGGTLGFHRELHRQLGDFDPAFPYLHDTDFCIKAHLRGYDIAFVKQAVLCYRFRTDPQSIFKQLKGYAEYNVRLSKRYRHTGAPPKYRWRRFIKEIAWLVPLYLSRNKSEVDLLYFYRRLGWSWGRFIGMIKYQMVPF